MTDYLDVADLLVIIDRIVGGTAGVRDVGLLTGAAGRPTATWNGVEVNPPSLGAWGPLWAPRSTRPAR